MKRSYLAGLFALALAMSAPAGTAQAADGDVKLKRSDPEAGLPPAVFPHWKHRIRFTCYACHPGLFEMKAGAMAMTMDALMAGKACGVCHNGTTAWAIDFETCNRCHREP